jgi:hypothetical protein
MHTYKYVIDFPKPYVNIKNNSGEDPGQNKSSASPCVSYEAIEWGGPSDETGKTESRVAVGVAR